MKEDTVTCDPVSGSSYLSQTLRKFYTDGIIRTVLVPLINQTGPVSLRALDWLVVNYAKQYNVVCTTTKGELFNIYNEYKISLSVYRRSQFDPFRRGKRHTFVCDGVQYETTLGQINFVYWAYTNGCLQYAAENAALIEQDMNAFSTQHKTKLRELKRKGITHKRSSLTSTNPVKCHVHSRTSKIAF